jgi:quercetin dioxygenase-like cupin family protein
MNRAPVMLGIVFTVGIAVGTLASQLVVAQPQPITRTILQQKDLEGAEGREVVMYRAELNEGAVAGRHFHPGPELLYVLEGSLILEADGHAPTTLKVGETAHIPAKHIHNARNANPSGPTKVLVVLVGEKGQPLATPVK